MNVLPDLANATVITDEQYDMLINPVFDTQTTNESGDVSTYYWSQGRLYVIHG